MDVKPGTYLHYKGKLYKLLAVGRHSETLEEVVIYQALYDDQEFGKNAFWVRPKVMFSEKVIVEGKEVPRFMWLSE